MPDIFDTVSEESSRDIFDEVAEPSDIELRMGVPTPDKRVALNPAEQESVAKLRQFQEANQKPHPIQDAIREQIRLTKEKITHPFDTIGNMPVELGNALLGTKDPIPFPPGHENAFRIEVPPDANIRPSLRPYAEAVAETGSSITDPNVLVTLPFVETKVLGVPSALGKFYVGQMASQLPQGAIELKRILEDPNTDSDTKKKVATEYALLFGGTALGAKGATIERGAPKYSIPKEVQESAKVLPKAAEEIAKVEPVKPTTPEVSDATQERKVEGSVPAERAGDDKGRAPTEAGVGSSVRPAEEVPQSPVALKPALKVGDKIYPAEGSEASHVEIIQRVKAGPQPDLTGLEEGFVDAQGKFIDRQSAAKETGLPTETEPGKLHSSDLPDKPLNPGGALKDLPQELQDKSNAVKDAMRAQYEALKKQSKQPPPPEEPKIGGMGGAVPSEFETSPQTPTGIKNATVDKERSIRGLPPAVQPARKSFGEVWDRAMARIDQDPAAQDQLIKELKDKPRALTDEEDAILLQRR